MQSYNNEFWISLNLLLQNWPGRLWCGCYYPWEDTVMNGLLDDYQPWVFLSVLSQFILFIRIFSFEYSKICSLLPWKTSRSGCTALITLVVGHVDFSQAHIGSDAINVGNVAENYKKKERTEAMLLKNLLYFMLNSRKKKKKNHEIKIRTEKGKKIYFIIEDRKQPKADLPLREFVIVYFS